MSLLSHTLRIVVFALALCAGLAARPAVAGPAMTLIEQFNLSFIDILRTDDRLVAPGQPGRYRRLSDHLAENFDIPEMLEQATGTQWAYASEFDRTVAVDAFLRFSVSTYLSRFESYSGEYFQILGEEQGRDGNTRITTKLIRPGRINVSVTYIVRQTHGEARIVDVIFGGGASEVATRKAEFAETLNRRGLRGLTAKLNDQADKIIADFRAPLQRDAAARTYASTN